LSKSALRLGKFDWIWAKSKPYIPQNIRSPTVMLYTQN